MQKNTLKTDSKSYNKVAVWLHWSIGGLIGFLLVVGFLMGNISKDDTALRFMVYNWHKTIGMLILVLSIVRLLWKLTHKAPAPLPGLKAWEMLMAKSLHALFYVFMIGMPLVGWAIISTSSSRSFLFGSPALPMPELPFWQDLAEEARKHTHHLFEDIHKYMAFAAIALILLHVFAALKHHKAGRDILVRMMPNYTRKSDK